ncbi:MAG: alpha/beta fold hydrolase [Myxococcales bacterium]
MATLCLVLLCSCTTRNFFFEPVKDYGRLPSAEVSTTEEIRFPSSNGNALTGWILKPSSKAPVATVLYLHGNYGNVSLMLFSVEPLVAAGFQVLTFDYQGYGRSEGVASQEGILADAQAALLYARGRSDLGDVPFLVFGQSMGGHLAVMLAARNPEALDALVIEGAYTGFKDIAAAFASRPLAEILVPETYRGLDEIADIHVPVLVIHSVDDALVPYAMGEQLFARANEPKTFWRVTGRHIRTAERDPQGFVDHFRALVEALPSLFEGWSRDGR